MKIPWLTFTLLLVAGTAWSGDVVTFEFVHGKGQNAQTYRATTSDPALIADVRSELAKPVAARTRHITGLIERAATKENPPWHWRFVPDKWKLAELSAEVCDGQPSYVDEHLDEWLSSVKSYCPWSSRASREVKK